jgi:exonuclease SbcC
MKLGEMTWRDVHSYEGEHGIDWAALSLACMTGSNGSGKSTVVDVLRWAVFGTTRDDANSIIRRGADNCEATIHFDHAGVPYRVKRRRSRKSGGRTDVAFELCDEEQTRQAAEPIWISAGLAGKTNRETQANIEAVLGMDDALFAATVLASQGEAGAFAGATPADRKEVLAGLLRLEEWERRAVAARSEREQITLEIERLTQRHAELAAALEATAGAPHILETARTEAKAVEEQLEGLKQKHTASIEAERRLADEAEKAAAEWAKHEAIASEAARLQVDRINAGDELQKLEAERESGKDVPERLKAAHAARERVAEFARQEQQNKDLDAQAEGVLRSAENAQREHDAKIRDADRAALVARQMHDQKLLAAQRGLDEAMAQSKLLAEVPCTALNVGDLQYNCKLLESAREAERQIEGIEKACGIIEEAEPWAEHEREAKVLRSESPADGLMTTHQDLLNRKHVLVMHEISAAKEGAAEIDALLKASARQEQIGELIEAARARYASADKRHQELVAERDALAADLGDQKDYGALRREAAAATQTWGEEVTRADAALVDARKEIAYLTAAVEQRTKQAAEGCKLNADLKAAEDRQSLLGALGDPRTGAFGKGGIPALLIEQAVPALAEEAHGILQQMSGGRLALGMAMQRETGDNRTVETLDINVSDTEGERPYESFSGGERMRVDVALRVAMSTLLAQRAGAPIDLLILDETAAPLDTDGRQVLSECLRQIADRYSNVLLITHVEELQDLLPTRILVNRDEQGSRLEVIG